MDSRTTMRMIPVFQFTVNQNEMLLILKALGGRLKEDEDEDARELCNKLTAERAQALEQTAAQLRRAAPPRGR
jgi:4-hydroxy-3-methylbut-2-enyl diphosphate reductase IspH